MICAATRVGSIPATPGVRRVLLLFACLSSLSYRPALGDGCYWPIEAIKKIPEIVTQRAVLCWRDGVETLVISSALDSQSQELGWIIPLPSVPTVIEKADPGGLKTLSFCIQPQITHDLSSEVAGIAWLLGFAILSVVIFLYYRARLWKFWVGFLILLWLFNFLLVFSRLGGFTANEPSVQIVEKTAQVGSYAVTVVRASRVADLDDWLGRNGFAALPTEANKVVEALVLDGWTFAAIKLRRDESGANAPHPIRIRFSSRHAVYPLRMTALAGGSPTFELFVVGEKRAAADLLTTEFCDRFTGYEPTRREKWIPQVPYFQAGRTGLTIGHPEILPLLWDGCVLTKLVGKIAAAAMTHDLEVSWQEFHPYQRHLFTPTGAGSVGAIVFEVLAGTFVLVSLIAGRRRIRESGGWRFWISPRWLSALGATVVVGLIVPSALPKLSLQEVRLGRRLSSNQEIHALADALESFFDENPDLLTQSEPEICSAVLRRLAESGGPQKPWTTPLSENQIFGGKVRVESTPGNFTVEKWGSVAIVRLYDFAGRPWRLELPTSDH